MDHRRIGWAFVAVQAALLVALFLTPSTDHWGARDLSRTLGAMLFWAGAALAVTAALGLGRSLTATPVPRATAELQTSGLYRWVRHPIYTAVLTMCVGMTLSRRSWLAVVLTVALVAFFVAKSTWEERRLSERFAGYRDYAARTGRFLPRLRRRTV
ncbi:MAG: isoprenylcysteine carboxylmethyltransferase family protein [Actinomycetota bacterium]